MNEFPNHQEHRPIVTHSPRGSPSPVSEPEHNLQANQEQAATLRQAQINASRMTGAAIMTASTKTSNRMLPHRPNQRPFNR